MIDAMLVRALHQEVGDRIQVEQSRRRGQGESRLEGEAERQFARAVINSVIRDHNESRLTNSTEPLAQDEQIEVAEGIYARLFGAGRLQRLLEDESIENIDINAWDEVWVTRTDGKFVRDQPIAESDEELIELVQTLGSYAGLSSRPFDEANPILDLKLPDGSRMSATMAVSASPQVSVRRHRFKQVGFSDLVSNGTLSEDVAGFLTAAVKARFNIVIAGAMNSGKTTLLRAMAAEIGPEERIITVENALELGLKADTERHPNCVELESRPNNSEGHGEILLPELLRRTLRMNADRVIVGEVLGPEIVVMLNAMTQGNDGSLSTIHARSARDVFGRISTYAQQGHNLSRDVVHEMIAGAVDFVVYLDHDKKAGRRAVHTILEVAGMDSQSGVSSNDIFLPDPKGNATRVEHTAIVRHDDLVAAGWQPHGAPGSARWTP
jgi:pilus assembly protein CpaF